ncbi:MAG: hypothetical protein IPO92_05460 [Saprospiraceae bacterium]|nr:hypothetical protein [Saprospiraceae bacterium]
MQRNITDKISSNIANHLMDNKDKFIAMSSKTKEQSNLTRLLTTHQMYLKQRTQAYAALEKTVYDTMPGLMMFWEINVKLFTRPFTEIFFKNKVVKNTTFIIIKNKRYKF